MKTLDIIDTLRVGEVVPKRVLSVLKRAGVIEDYTMYGYLFEQDSYMGIREYKGRFFQAKYLDGCFYPYLFKADINVVDRMDYMQFISEYSHDVKWDDLYRKAWDLADKLSIAPRKTLAYLKRKHDGCPDVKFRTPLRKVNRSVCLWGAIL